MSYCLAKRSMRGSSAGAACAVMSGMPAARAYAKYFSTSGSLSWSNEITPPPTIWSPAASISLRASASSVADSSYGRCTDLKLT